MEKWPLTDDDIDEGKSVTLPSCSNNEHSYLVIEFLSKGAFGKIYKVKDTNNDEIFAMKTIAKPQSDAEFYEKDLGQIEQEKCILEITRGHAFLVGLECFFQTSSHFVFVMDYINGCSLCEFMDCRYSEPVVRFYGAELCLALNFLHEKGIIHRDLKPDNVLIDVNGHIKLIDYGMSKCGLENSGRTDSDVGSDLFMSLEMYGGLSYKNSVDWFSFGIILYMLLVYDHPFLKLREKPDDWEIPSKSALGKFLMDSMASGPISYPEDVSESAKLLLDGLICLVAEYRLGYNGFTEIKQHDFFASTEWDKIEKKELPAPWKDEVQIRMNTLKSQNDDTKNKETFEDFDSCSKATASEAESH